MMSYRPLLALLLAGIAHAADPRQLTKKPATIAPTRKFKPIKFKTDAKRLT